MSPLFVTILLVVGVGLFAKTMLGRVGAMRALKAVPGNRMDRVPERLTAVLQFWLGQKRMVDREEIVPGLMHVAIFASFLVLQLRTMMLFTMAFSTSAIELLTNLSTRSG